MRLPRALALVATTITVATAAFTITPASATNTPWTDDGGLVFMGDGAELPTAPRDVWAGLAGRSITTLGTGGAGRHTCVIDDNGQAVCIGYSGRGQLGIGTRYDTSSAAAVTTDGALAGVTLTDISTGTEHTCAVATNGNAYCWGASNQGQVGSGTTRRSVYAPTAVDTGGVLAGKTLTTITAGGQHSCALDSSGLAYCWGRGKQGQLGDGTTSDAARPVAVDTSGALAGKVLTSIDAGTNHTCAVASNGAAFCWGAGAQGQLGNGKTRKSATPVKVTDTGSSLPVREISAGLGHTCLVTNAGSPYCWGDGSDGQLGNGTTDAHLVPTAVANLTNFGLISITTGDAHTCAVTSNHATFCWGRGNAGQLGTGVLDGSLIPVQTSAGDIDHDNADALVATGNGNCELTIGGGVYCWGPRGTYLPGDGAFATTPTKVASDPTLLDGQTIKQITDDAIHTCALTSAGVAYCWGYGAQGQLGIGSFSANYRPQPVVTSGALSGVTLNDITAGEYHTCALSTAGKAYCWGSGDAGQIGDGDATSRKVPRAVDTSGVLAGKKLVDISAGDVFTCALDSAGKAYCWGGGFQGQLGNGAMSASSVPVAVSTSGVLKGKNLVAIDAGYSHVCALSASGKVYCWGNNFYGELGNATFTNSDAPVAVDTTGVLNGKSLVDVSAGDKTTCAVSVAGKAFCWGYGSLGALGDGTTAERNTTPHAVDVSGALSAVTVTDVSVGGLSVCVLSIEGYPYCWGSSSSGQLGYGGYDTQTRPVAVYAGGTLANARVTQIGTSRATWMVTEQR